MLSGTEQTGQGCLKLGALWNQPAAVGPAGNPRSRQGAPKSFHAFPTGYVSTNVSRLACGVCLVLLPVWAAEPDLGRILKGIENRYNRAQTIEVLFEQTYGGPARNRRVERGELFLRKPGKMRWEYSSPEGKLFVTDGKYAWLYTPSASRVEKTRIKETDDMRAPLAFLLGKLDFQRDFRRLVWRPQGPDYWVVAEPKSDQLAYTQVEFLVNPQFQIRALRITGQDRSVMEFRFDQERINPPLKDNLFEFTPPAGAAVVEAAR